MPSGSLIPSILDKNVMGWYTTARNDNMKENNREAVTGKTISLKEEAEAMETARQHLLEQSREGCLIGTSKLVVYCTLTVPVVMDLSDGHWNNFPYLGVYSALTLGLWIGQNGIINEFGRSVKKRHEASKLKKR